MKQTYKFSFSVAGKQAIAVLSGKCFDEVYAQFRSLHPGATAIVAESI